jgi:ubiquinone/menaquinone biosynthesis C-methylase UbiE
MDITDVKFGNNFFDVILCSHVLEHIPDDLKAMSELYRVLRPGGTAILQVPLGKNMSTTYEDFSITTPAGRAKAFWSEEHVRIYGSDFKDRLKSVGFKILEDNYIASFSETERLTYGLPNDDATYYIEGFVVVTK